MRIDVDTLYSLHTTPWTPPCIRLPSVYETRAVKYTRQHTSGKDMVADCISYEAVTAISGSLARLRNIILTWRPSQLVVFLKHDRILSVWHRGTAARRGSRLHYDWAGGRLMIYTLGLESRGEPGHKNCDIHSFFEPLRLTPSSTVRLQVARAHAHGGRIKCLQKQVARMSHKASSRRIGCFHSLDKNSHEAAHGTAHLARIARESRVSRQHIAGPFWP